MKKTRKTVIQEINTQIDNESLFIDDVMNTAFYQYDEEKSKDMFDLSSDETKKKKLGKKRKNIESSMPAKYTAKDLSRLISRQDKLVSDLKTEESRRVRKLSDLDDTQAELDEIEKVLRMYANGETFEEDEVNKFDEDDMKEVAKSLNFKKARDLSQLLMNEHSKNDSEEMKALKCEVLTLSYYLEAVKDQVVTKDEIDDLRVQYAVTIKFLEDYLSTKKQNKRYEKVFAVWQSLSYEYDSLTVIRDENFNDRKDYTMGELLGMSRAKESDVKRGKTKKKEDKQREDGQYSEGTLSALKIFGEDHNLNEAFAGVGDKEKDKKKLAGQYIALLKGINEFKPGQVQVLDISVMGKKVRILQTADNDLYVIDKHERVPLERSAQSLRDEITGDIMLRSDIYGDEAVYDILTSYEKRYDKKYEDAKDITQGEHTQIRNDVTAFLAHRLGLRPDDFTNVRRTTMVSYAKALTSGKKTVQQIKELMISAKKSEDLINGIELTELMELDAERGGALDENVSMYKLQAEADDNDWTEDEKTVKNLMSELIYTSDTLIMDKNADTPGEFVRSVLLSNIKALEILIKDNGEQGEDIISSIMKKMSLDKVSGDKNDTFAETIASSLKGLVSFFKTKQNADIKRLLENKQDAETEEKLVLANTAMEESIKKSSDIMQKNVNTIVDAMFEKTEDEDADTLEGIMKNATRTEAGQGLFIRTVLKNYFSSMKIIDQRAMLSSALRSCKKVEPKKYSDRRLLEEIKDRKLSKYKDFYDKDVDNLTKEELELVREYGRQKEALEIGSNYFAGLIRGAGPLLHKMLQGIPEDSLPAEIRLALRDVKSKLPPIPERVVKTQMNAMIERSDGAITRIEVIQNLGAASVGQTFRCRVYGPNIPKEGKNVVIKLLRPDCQNRMKREEKVMLDCAKKVEGMYETYKGQLSNYYAELDLSKEYKNIQEGQIYNGKYANVKSEKASNIITPTPNSLMIEEAPGKTLDDILLGSEKIRREIYTSLHPSYITKDGELEYYKKIPLNEENIEKTKKARYKLIDLANDLIIKRDMMANITKVWIEEALFGSGYYHADLHAGNILLSDKEGTLIDFGNAVKFTKEQQKSITRMMTAAAASNVNMFFEEFNSLLTMNEDFKKFYTEEKQKQVKEAFKEILEMGDNEEAGERISAALIRASELGVKLPPSIYNFSQGQLRLQKSIDDINHQIKKIDDDLYRLDVDLKEMGNNELGLNVMINKAYVSKKNRKDFTASIKQQIDSLFGVDEETFTKALLDNTYKEGNVEEGVATVDKRKEFNNMYLGEVVNMEKSLKGCFNNKQLPDFKQYRTIWNEFKDKWKAKYEELEKSGLSEEEKKRALKELKKQHSDDKDITIWKLSPENGGHPIATALGLIEMLPRVVAALLNLDDTSIEPLLNVYENLIPTGLELEKKVKELRELQDENKLSEEKKKTLSKEIYRLYQKYNTYKMQGANPFTSAFNLSMRTALTLDRRKEDLDMMLKEKTKTTIKQDGKNVEITLGELFGQKLDEYYKVITDYCPMDGSQWNMNVMPEEEKKKALDISKELTKIHLEITKIQAKRFYEGRYEKDIPIKSFDFTDVMKTIIKNNFGKFTGNVGIFNLIGMGGKALLDYMAANK